MTEIEIVEFTAEDEGLLAVAWDVRMDVFVGEQEVPVEEEIDDSDTAETTVHVVALAAGTSAAATTDDAAGRVRALGTARLLGEPTDAVRHIGRVAVRREARGLHVGEALMRALEDRAAAQAKEAGLGRLVVELSAQEQAMGFYARLGYAAISGESYLDAGIPHQDMRLTREV